jgi:CxxC-x17-CxxC domain-containing protein
MHKASCAECGNSCEVPFKPNGKKPVLCGDCFRKDDNGGERSERSERPSFRSNDRSFDRPTRFDGDKPSYPATCGDCGARCTVPFKPMQGKPVKCRECFVPGDRPSSTGGSGMTQEQFQMLNTKLDAILKAVGAYVSTPKRLKEPTDEFSLEVDTTPTEKPEKKAWAKLKYKK